MDDSTLPPLATTFQIARGGGGGGKYSSTSTTTTQYSYTANVTEIPALLLWSLFLITIVVGIIMDYH